MPVKHGPKGVRGTVAIRNAAKEASGTPYTVGEAREWLNLYGERIDIYPRELMEWLCDRVEALEDFGGTLKAGPPPGVPRSGGRGRR